jgi:tryptophan synthase alpha chain
MNKGETDMSRIKNAFADGKALIAFLTAGDPTPEDSVRFVLAMEKAGADLIEIGVPFSDPVADGPVIMAADQRALAGGINLKSVLDEVQEIRKTSDIPLVLLTYFNPIFVYGAERFFEDCRKAGADGVIIPDLPFEEQGDVRPYADRCGVDMIQLVAPTSKERIQRIARAASGFIYVVSSMGVTGMRDGMQGDLKETLRQIRQVSNVPAAVGFGIHTEEQAALFASEADGVITGSAVVDIIARHGKSADDELSDYIKKMKKAVR